MSKMRQWSILTAVAVLVVFVAGWFLLIKPQRSHAATLRASALTQQQANQQLQQQIAKDESEQKNLPREQQELAKSAIEIPNNEAQPTIVRQLVGAANRADVDLITITPGVAATVTSTDTTPDTSTGATPGSTALTAAAATPSTLVALPVSLGITGTYPNVEAFFNALERLPRALMITGWTLCPEESSNSTSGGCSGPTPPANKTLPTGALGASVSAEVFYAPPAAPAASTTTLAPGATTTTTGTSTTGTTTPTTSTTPSAATSAPAS
jgi:type IV pilus assembly protein PilO